MPAPGGHNQAQSLRVKLLGLGFPGIEDLGPPQIAARYFPSRASFAPERGGHILHAVQTGRHSTAK